MAENVQPPHDVELVIPIEREFPAMAPPVLQVTLNILERRALRTILSHPLTFVTTLTRLGYEPYPLCMGKKWLFFGAPTYFRPNIFTYLKNICLSHGLSAMYAGVVAHLAAHLASDLCYAIIFRYLNALPDFGGHLDDELLEAINLHELTTFQRVRLHVRRAIIGTFSFTIASIAVRPLIVVMMRQIAQHVGDEAKYTSTGIMQPLRLIAAEEGWAGLFAGLIPSVVGGVLCLLASEVTGAVIQEYVIYMEREVIDMRDQENRLLWTSLRYCIRSLCGTFVRALVHPFSVVTTLMAVNGSGLAVDMPPFVPSPHHPFAHWSDVYNHLRPNDLFRGLHLYLRHEHGPVAMGVDGKMYAAAGGTPNFIH